MKTFWLALALVVSTAVSQQAMANDSAEPFTAAEVGQLMNGAGDAKLLACVLAYDFEFVTQILGLKVSVTTDNGSQSSDQSDKSAQDQGPRFDQIRKFMRTGRLTRSENARALKLKDSKEAVYRCQVLAESAMEVFALQLRLQQVDVDPTVTPAKSQRDDSI